MRTASDRIRHAQSSAFGPVPGCPLQGLVRRLRTGDDAAFEEFFVDAFPRLFRYALARMSRDTDGAEEVVQAALCKAVGKLHTLREDPALFPLRSSEKAAESLLARARAAFRERFERDDRCRTKPLVAVAQPATRWSHG